MQLGVGLSLSLFPSFLALGCGALDCGALGLCWRGLASFPGAPCEIRVSTYCEKRARSGIITGEMKHTHTQEEIAYNRALAVFEKMVWAEKGSALRASLEARFATLHAAWLATVKKGGAL